MNEEILINVTPQETRVAVVENGVLQEVLIERARNRGIVGNIYRGRVARVLPGIQAAFIDIGLDRTAFLHAGDVLPDGPGDERAPGDEYVTPPISGLLRDGQLLMVQVIKDPLGSKGARLTTQVAIPARNLVYLPNGDHLGVSQRIQDPDTREQLKTMVLAERAELSLRGGLIIRTAAEAARAEEVRADLAFLRKIWDRVQERMNTAPPASLIHEDIPLAMRIMRDLVADVEKVRVDSRETYQKLRAFAVDLIPEAVERIEYYPGERPIFDLYSVEDEIKRALDKQVPLKSGGYLVIDPTEAMTTVDVNTGAFVGRRNLEETLFKTNLEAAHAIARQLRLRNIGGIVIVDFIDMADPEHRRQVMRALDKALARDRTKIHLVEMSPLGLVEITRKRTRDSIERLLTEPCCVCGGRGVLKTPQTVCYEIFREILREARQFGVNEYLVVAAQVVVDMLLDEESASLADLQEFIGKSIHLQVESSYHQESYDVVLM